MKLTISFKPILLLTLSCLQVGFYYLQVNGQGRRNLLSKPDQWYTSDEAINAADNVLLFQRNAGGWELGNNYFKKYSEPEKVKLSNEKYKRDCSFRGYATYTELEFLARIYTATKDEKYRLAFNHGLDMVFEAQYKNGGFPKHYPEPNLIWFKDAQSKWNANGFEHYIAYNDDAMVGVLWLLKKIADNHKEKDFAFVDIERRKKAIAELEKGIDCTLNIQFYYDGKLTAWPQQADEFTLVPRWGRYFEPPAIALNESSGILRFLMAIENPDQRIIRSIQSAVKWIDDVKILNTAILHGDTMTVMCEVTKIPKTGRRDMYIKYDKNAPPVWARFYELNTFRPIFCSKDDTVRYNFADISLERRSGYAWYGNWPEKILKENYPEWCKKYKQLNILANSN